MKNIKKEVGARIRQYRLQKKLSQEKLAELSDLNTVYIGVIERGEKNPSIEILYKISKGLGINICDLLKNIDETESDIDKYPQMMYSLMLELDKNEQKIIYDLATTALRLNKKK